MLVKPITDAVDIKKILLNPSIYDAITTDNSPLPSDFEPPINASCNYIGCYLGGEIIGLMVYHSFDDGNKCHFMVLPEFRQKHAKEFLEYSLCYRGDLPLYVEIPTLNRSVILFALTNGFKKVKVNKKKSLKNGKIYDTNILIYNHEV